MHQDFPGDQCFLIYAHLFTRRFVALSDVSEVWLLCFLSGTFLSENYLNTITNTVRWSNWLEAP